MIARRVVMRHATCAPMIIPCAFQSAFAIDMVLQGTAWRDGEFTTNVSTRRNTDTHRLIAHTSGAMTRRLSTKR